MIRRSRIVVSGYYSAAHTQKINHTQTCLKPEFVLFDVKTSQKSASIDAEITRHQHNEDKNFQMIRPSLGTQTQKQNEKPTHTRPDAGTQKAG